MRSTFLPACLAIVAPWFGARRTARVRPQGVRARDAALLFRTCAEKPSTDLADAFAEFVAGCLGCPMRVVIGPDLSTRLVNAGVSRELASQAAELFDALVASRYAGRVPECRIRRAHKLVDALEANFREIEAQE